MDEVSSQNKRKAVDTEKASILNILEELGKDDFEKFKWYLEQENVEGLEPLKKMDLEKADNRMQTTDLIVQTYTINAAQIVNNVLKKMHRNDLLEKRSKIHKADVSDVGESSGSSLLTASSQPPQEDGTKQKTLMDKIEPVTPWNPLKEPGVSPDRTLRTTAMQNNKCPIASKLLFMRMMTDTQFKHFKTSLIECDCVDCDHALRLLDPTDESLPPIGEEEGGEKTSVTIQYRDESDDEDAGTTGCTNEGITTGEKLRKYQTELAQPVYERQNTIICAPTGCGKTRVALAISDQHLKTAHPGSKKPKVVFMATTVVLCEQQLQWFQRYFKFIPNIRIKGLCGEHADQISLSSIVETNDIIVLTPQILVNALQKNDITSLSRFSLLIFDECHNTTGKDPYNIIMFKYLDNQLDNTGDTLPQIVGLTASVGIGSFKNKGEAVSNISRLCANLNSKVISTVKENKEELRSFVRVPKKEFCLVEERSSTKFIRVIQDLMRRIETEAKRVYDIDSLSSIPSCSDYGSKKYEQWIVDVQKRYTVQQRDDISEEKQSHACRALYNYTEHLRKYNDALIINEDARTKDALDFLSVFIEQFKQAGNDETEKQLIQYFQDQEVYLRELTTGGQHENPKLSKLQYILQNKYREKPDTSTVVFVKTRALAYALKRWIEETDVLKYLKPEVLLGRRRHQLELTGSGHMTLNKRVLERFKSSSNQSNLLIATSVGEEGIDLPLCNLIIMYENVGNVVKMIQVRGRGRAQDSVCILLSNKTELIDKEKMNMQKESIVEEAVHYIQTHSQELDDKMCEFQNQGRVQRQQKPSLPVKQEGEYTLNCKKCRRKACSSDDIRVLDCQHHIVLDRSLFDRTELNPKPKDIGNGVAKKWKLLCVDCGQDWGIGATFKNKDLPIIKIDSFTVRREEDKKLLSFKKWKDVPFPIKPFDLSEVPHDWPALDLL